MTEWIEQKLYPLHSQLIELRESADRLMKVRSWPSRPYEPLEMFNKHGKEIVETGPIEVEVESSTGNKIRKVQAPDYYSSRRKIP